MREPVLSAIASSIGMLGRGAIEAPMLAPYTRSMIDPGELDLPEGCLVLVDAGPLVYYLEEGPGSPRGSVFASFAAAARAGSLRLAASALAWTELLAGALAKGDAAGAGACRSLLADSSLIRIEPIEVSIAEGAALLLASTRPRLGLADAFHIATAASIGAGAVLTNDEAWRRVPGCPRVLLVDELAFEAP